MVKGTGREERVHSVFWYMKHLTCNLRALRDTTPRLCVVVKLNISHHNTGGRDRCLPVRYMFKCTHTSHVCNMCVYTHKDTQGTCLGGDAVYTHRVQVHRCTCMMLYPRQGTEIVLVRVEYSGTGVHARGTVYLILIYTVYMVHVVLV